MSMPDELWADPLSLKEHKINYVSDYAREGETRYAHVDTLIERLEGLRELDHARDIDGIFESNLVYTQRKIHNAAIDAAIGLIREDHPEHKFTKDKCACNAGSYSPDGPCECK